MTTRFKAVLLQGASEAVTDDSSEPTFTAPAVNPSEKVCSSFRAALRYKSSDDDDSLPTMADTSSDFVDHPDVGTLHDSPLIKMPIPHRAIYGLTSDQSVEWSRIVDLIRVHARHSGSNRRRFEITLSQGVFKGTLIKIFYDGKWFVVDIQTTPIIEQIIDSQIDNLINRLFSCSVDWVRVFLRRYDQDCLHGQLWTGTKGVIRCCRSRVRN
ncbi:MULTISPECIES: hypothetical protein [Candidatus Ichthyocystis]|uniref:Putative exported protein n=1 Tax=Candidatus Ichthyocystis hellenicum TaxID=1561003 RepID=A0A0S4LZR1_9BURK|nr:MULTISPECIES: hypothetical protein [Ichthyocystis]CUT17065.1 putative exported protein [Candidatus Ichthyocystis hellenicum]